MLEGRKLVATIEWPEFTLSVLALLIVVGVWGLPWVAGLVIALGALAVNVVGQWAVQWLGMRRQP